MTQQILDGIICPITGFELKKPDNKDPRARVQNSRAAYYRKWYEKNRERRIREYREKRSGFVK